MINTDGKPTIAMPASDVCCSDPGDCQRDCDREADTQLSFPYFDSDGNEGTLGEVYSS